MDDLELMRRYVESRSEEAFAELVRRYLPLVFSAALRQVGGDRHSAEEVAQSVFRDLARKAPQVARHPLPLAWLYTSTHHAAAKLMRSERRRRRRELEAQMLYEQNTDPAARIDWEQIRPVLDLSLHGLNRPDREAVLLRYFDNRSLAAVGRSLGISEDAARKRVDRALDRLRGVLARRGVDSTAGALALALTSQATAQVPAGLAAMIASAATTGVTASGGGLGLITFMSTPKVLAAVAIGILLADAVLLRSAQLQSRRLAADQAGWQSELAVATAENQRQRRVLAALTASDSAAATPTTAAQRGRETADILGSGLLGIQGWPLPSNGPGQPPQLAVGAVQLAALLEFDQDQTEALGNAVRRGEQRIREALPTGVTVQQAGESVLLQLDPEAGAAARLAYDDLLAGMVAVVGPEGFELLQKAGLIQTLQDLFKYWGLDSRLIAIRLQAPDSQPTAGPGNWVYELRYLGEDAVAEISDFENLPMQGQSSSNVRSNARSNLNVMLGPLASRLPADF